MSLVVQQESTAYEVRCELGSDSAHRGKVFPAICTLVYLKLPCVVFASAFLPEVPAVAMRAGGHFYLDHTGGAGGQVYTRSVK